MLYMSLFGQLEVIYNIYNKVLLHVFYESYRHAPGSISICDNRLAGSGDDRIAGSGLTEEQYDSPLIIIIGKFGPQSAVTG